MDLTILLEEWNSKEKNFYSSFEEFKEIKLSQIKTEQKPTRGHYDNLGFRVLGREGLMDDSSIEQLAYFAEVHSRLHNNDYDPDLYKRLIKMQKEKEDAAINQMKLKLKEFQNGTI